jgi:ankyrin repeat protein
MNYLNVKLIAFLTLICLSIASRAQEDDITPVIDTAQTILDRNYELLNAASDGDTLKLKKLIDQGADVNFNTPYEGVTALMYAAQNGHLETVRIILHHGAQVNAMPENQVSALLSACMAGYVYIADTLILNGANVNTKNSDGVTPLMIAAAYNDSIMADMLIFYKADLNMQDVKGNTALHYATYYGSSGVSELLIEKQAKINMADNQGFTPLMIAAQNGYSYLAELFIRNGAVVDTVNDNNLTALSFAIINQHPEMVNLLIQNGANVNHKISGTRNQYSLAKEFYNSDVLQLLQSNGAGNIPAPIIERVMVNFDLNGNLDDFMIGGTLSIASIKYGIELQAGYKTRTRAKTVLYEIDPTTYYQFWESRSVMHLGANKLFKVFKNSVRKKSGVFAGLNLAYTYGNYRGSERKPDDTFILVPKAGVFWSSNSFNVKLNYEYMNLKNTNVSPHRFNLSIGFNINTGKGKITLKAEPNW